MCISRCVRAEVKNMLGKKCATGEAQIILSTIRRPNGGVQLTLDDERGKLKAIKKE